MNYELALELKNAGFPQNGTNYTPDHGGSEDTAAYYPSLEELIKACGDQFYSVVFATDRDWRAFGEASRMHADGATPIEAVAHLYIAINKKI